MVRLNKPQKIIILLFSLFLLVISFFFLSEGDSLSAIFAIALSGGGFFFFFSKITISSKAKKRWKATFKIFGILLLLFILFLVGVLIYDKHIRKVTEPFRPVRKIGQEEGNAKFISVEQCELFSPNKDVLFSKHNIRCSVRNNSDKILTDLDIVIGYFTKDGYLIENEKVDNYLDKVVIPPKQSKTIIKEIKLHYEPNQAYDFRIKPYRATLEKPIKIKKTKPQDSKKDTRLCAEGLDNQLIEAVKQGDTVAVKELLAKEADVNAKDRHDNTALMVAAREGAPETVKVLIKAGADVDAKDEVGWTPLIYASIHGRTGIVKALIEAGADVNAKDKNSKTVLRWAADEGHAEIVNLLKKHGARK